MNKQINAILVATLVALVATSMADSGPETSAKDTKKMVQNNFVETAQKGIKLSGYVDAGYSYNFTGAANGTSDASGRFGSDTAGKGDFNLYAVKIALEKALNSENKAQAGFRTDVMIGEDANYLINRTTPNTLDNHNQNSNSLFLEQAYVSIRAPVGNGWDFKVGKFVSILGYEVIERPANMNITYGLLWQAMPLYYTGVLSSYKFDDYLDGKLGVVNGSNTDNNTTTGGAGDGCSVLAALNVTAPGGNANWSNNFQYSSNSENNTYQGPTFNTIRAIALDGNSGSGYTFMYNTWGNWAPKFAEDKLLLAFNVLLKTTGGAGGGGGTVDPFNGPEPLSQTANSTTYGFGAYAKYQFNDWFSLVSRGEYLAYNLPYADARNCLWEYTITAGFNVIDNLLIRAEYRLDWGTDSVNNTGNTVNSPTDAGQVTSSGPAHYAGAEVVYSF